MIQLGHAHTVQHKGPHPYLIIIRIHQGGLSGGLTHAGTHNNAALTHTEEWWPIKVLMINVWLQARSCGSETEWRLGAMCYIFPNGNLMERKREWEMSERLKRQSGCFTLALLTPPSLVPAHPLISFIFSSVFVPLLFFLLTCIFLSSHLPPSTSRRVSVGSAHSNLFCLNAPNGQTRTVPHTRWFTFIHWHTHLLAHPPPPSFPDTKKAPAGSLRSAHAHMCTCRSVHKNTHRLVGSWLLGYALLLLFLSVPSFIMDAARERV